MLFSRAHIYKVLLVALAAGVSATGCRKSETGGYGTMLRKTISVRPYATSTKGSVATTSTLENKGRFVLEAYVDEEYFNIAEDPDRAHPNRPGKYIDRVALGNVIYSNGLWKITPESTWVQGINTTFWCWAPTYTTAIPDGMNTSRTVFEVEEYAAPYDSDQLTFTYARPGVAAFPLLNSNGTLNAKSDQFRDADIQDDILLAYAKQNYSEALGNDEVDLVFYHPLSQIRFAVSPDDGSFDSSLKIVQIAIKNIRQGGQCVFHGAESNKAEKFIWDLSASPLTSYCQNYNAAFKTAPENWTNEKYTKDGSTYKLYTTENVFFVTPQNLGTDATSASLDILFEDRGTYIEVEKPLPADVWKPGFYYTYKIGATVLGRTIKVNVSLLDWQNYDDKLFI